MEKHRKSRRLRKSRKKHRKAKSRTRRKSRKRSRKIKRGPRKTRKPSKKRVRRRTRRKFKYGEPKSTFIKITTRLGIRPMDLFLEKLVKKYGDYHILQNIATGRNPISPETEDKENFEIFKLLEMFSQSNNLPSDADPLVIPEYLMAAFREAFERGYVTFVDKPSNKREVLEVKLSKAEQKAFREAKKVGTLIQMLRDKGFTFTVEGARHRLAMSGNDVIKAYEHILGILEEDVRRFAVAYRAVTESLRVMGIPYTFDTVRDALVDTHNNPEYATMKIVRENFPNL